MDILTIILILIGFFLTYKLGHYIERNKSHEDIKKQKAELNSLLQNKKEELNEEKEKLSKIYEGYIVKKEKSLMKIKKNSRIIIGDL